MFLKNALLTLWIAFWIGMAFYTSLLAMGVR